ncbi:MAG: DNA replication and repair protein RecF, partial [Lachnospiraceae bacterium]|nr:DNA replication and repair protein RecF [Lachnospiraceae bacterium]
IILLDDVLSELDRNRQKQLIAGIEGMQTIITCTGLEEFVDSSTGTTKVFRVENGGISEIANEGQ